MQILKLKLVPVMILAAGLSACAADGTLDMGVTTASVEGSSKPDPVCTQLFAHIDGLRKEGISEKVEKAANKKYKMTSADLTKADQLNKANAEFQTKCTPQPIQASVQPAQAVAPAPSAQ